MTISFAVYDGLARGITAEELSEIHRKSFQESIEQVWSAAEISSLLLSPGVHVMVILQDAKAMGSLAMGFLMWRRTGEEAEILTNCILPAYRGLGMGSLVLQEFFILGGKPRIEEIFLEVRENNAAAIRLYEKNGFEIVGLRKDYYGRKGNDMINALIMKHVVQYTYK